MNLFLYKLINNFRSEHKDNVMNEYSIEINKINKIDKIK